MGELIVFIATINAIVSGVFSMGFNGYLIGAAANAKSAMIGHYKWIIIFSSAFDLTFSVLTTVACPTIAAIGNMSSVLFIKGGFRLPLVYGRCLLVIWIILLCTSIIVPPCLFVFQYIQVCRAQWMTLYGRRSLSLFLIPFGLAWSAASMLTVSAYPNDQDLAYFNDIASHMYLNEPRAYLVACLRPYAGDKDDVGSRILLASCIYLVCILFTSLFVMVICSRLIVVTVKRASSEGSTRLQHQVTKTLVIRFIIPFLFIQIPFYSCCLAPLFQVETGRAADYLPFLFAWSPALNPVVVMYFLKGLRPFKKTSFLISMVTANESLNKRRSHQSTVNFLRIRSPVIIKNHHGDIPLAGSPAIRA